ncbi:unnamed protein product [Urochloa humidicola]
MRLPVATSPWRLHPPPHHQATPSFLIIFPSSQWWAHHSVVFINSRQEVLNRTVLQKSPNDTPGRVKNFLPSTPLDALLPQSRFFPLPLTFRSLLQTPPLFQLLATASGPRLHCWICAKPSRVEVQAPGASKGVSNFLAVCALDSFSPSSKAHPPAALAVSCHLRLRGGWHEATCQE